jgi:hypothetical protein
VVEVMLRVRLISNAAKKITRVPTIVVAGFLIQAFRTRWYPWIRGSCSESFLKICELPDEWRVRRKYVAIGISIRATRSDTDRVEIIETPIFFPIIFTMKLSEKINGIKTITVVSVDANIDLQISVVPCLTAVSLLFP